MLSITMPPRNIAILSNFGHMECLGFILEIFRNDNVTVFMGPDTDNRGWMDYYTIVFPNIVPQISYDITTQEFIADVVANHDKVFCATYNECSHEQVTSIIHVDYERSNAVYKRPLISLTPYIQGDDIVYTFPVFRPPPSSPPSLQPIVAYIGFCRNDNIDEDTDLFIQTNWNYTFYFIIWGDCDYSNLQKHPNVVILSNIPTQMMIDIIQHSKFILSKKYINYDRFSGQLGLAMSFEKPMILDQRTADAYQLPGKYYQRELQEIGSLDSITDEIYGQIVGEIRAFNDATIKANKSILNNI